jgi:hypothetical protein
LEIVGPSLVLRTTLDYAQTPFTLTLFIALFDNVDMFEAHCDVNDGASIYIELENLKRQIWKSGRVSTKVPPAMKNITRVELRVCGITLGKLVRVSLDSETRGQRMVWSIGPNAISHGLDQETTQRLTAASIRSEDGTYLPLCRFMINADVIEMELANANDGAGYAVPEILVVETYVQCFSDDTGASGRMLLKVDCDEDVSVTAQCGYQRPQYLTSVYKPFEF